MNVRPQMNRSATFSLIVTSLLLLAAKPGDWPQWRGPNRNGSSGETGLVTEWSGDGPPVAWQVENVGVGYSSLSVSDGKIFTQGDLNGIEHIICLSEKDGSLIWAVQPEPVKAALDERIAKQFKGLDKNSDGQLDEQEAIAGLGGNAAKADSVADDADIAELAEQRTNTFFKQLDEDGDGKLSQSEFPRKMLNDFSRIDAPEKDANVDELAQTRTTTAIKQLDKDGDERISQQESRGTAMQSMFNRIDQRLPGERRGDGLLTAEELKTYYSTRERGRDGSITVEELQKYYTKTYPGRDGILTLSDIRRYFGGYRNGQGDGPRGTPTVEGNRIYVEGGFGDLSCLDAQSGKTIWHLNLASDLGGGRPGWGYCESPLIDGDQLIVTPGGNKGTVAALNKLNGEVIWRSTDVTDGAHYASAIVEEVHGVRQVIQFTRNRVVGLNAKTGKLLWDYSGAANGTANAATPIYKDGYVFTSSGYGTGGGLAKITRDGENFKAEEVYFENKMANHHGGIILVGDYMYGFGGSTLLCMDFKTGKIAWQSRSVGKGSLMYADGHLYLLGERNEVGLAVANPEEYIEKGRFSIPRSGRPSWAHPIVANGKFYIRDQNTLTAYDVKSGN